MTKKVVSILLCLAIIMSMTVPAMAINTTVSEKTMRINVTEDVYLDIVISPNKERKVNADSGDEFIIRQYVNDNLTQVVSGEVGTGKVFVVNYENSKVKNEEVLFTADRATVKSSTDEQPMEMRASSTNYGNVIGYIVYNKAYGSQREEELAVYSLKGTTKTGEYVINGAMGDTVSEFIAIGFDLIGAIIPFKSIAIKIFTGIFLRHVSGGIGDVITDSFTEEVDVKATPYTLRGYHAASNYYSLGYEGTEYYVTSTSSDHYGEWYYEGYTPHTWKDGDILANILWVSIFGGVYPYVKEYR